MLNNFVVHPERVSWNQLEEELGIEAIRNNLSELYRVIAEKQLEIDPNHKDEETFNKSLLSSSAARRVFFVEGAGEPLYRIVEGS